VNGDELFQRLRGELIGRRISFVRLACDMLLLYVDCEPGDGQGLTFWLNPPWEVSSPEGVVADSRQAQGEDDGGLTEAEFNHVSRPISEKLIDRPITEVGVDRRTRELTVTVAGEHDIKALASALGDDHLWHLRENATRLTLYASTAGWKVRVGKA
jgi:hypothetical protein